MAVPKDNESKKNIFCKKVIIKNYFISSRKYIYNIKDYIKRVFVKIVELVKKFFYAWKFVFISFFSFIFIYYGLGSIISEDIDVSSEYKINENNTQTFQTVNSMRYLVLREVDDKLWTPNLPVIFPAHVLDNMPNFQKGIIDSVKNVNKALRKDIYITAEQKSDLNKSYKLLSYAPDVWMFATGDSYKIASSSNKQYRKAAKFFAKYNEHGYFEAKEETLNLLLQAISDGLTKISQRSESYQQEHFSDFWDFNSDDIFYYNLGYSYALLQISKTISTDFKYIILENDAYVEFTYLLSSLQKILQYRPFIIRNGDPKSFWTPNHLIVQNYYISRAVSWLEKMRNRLIKE